MTKKKIIFTISIFFCSTYFVLDYISYNYFKQEFDIIRAFYYCIILLILSSLIFVTNYRLFKINSVNNFVFILLLQILTFNSNSIEIFLRSYLFGYEKIYLIIIYLIIIFFIISIFVICYKNIFNEKFLSLICFFLFLNLSYSFYENVLKKNFFIKKNINELENVQNINFQIKNKKKNKKKNKNIYFIVYDTKTDFQTLKELTNYYPNNYEDELKKMGFYIGEEVYSSSNITITSMNNILEMSDIFNKLNNIDLDFFKQIEKKYVNGKNSLINILKDNNYKYIFYKSGFTGYKDCPITSNVCFKKQSFFKQQDIVFLNKTPFLRIFSFFLDENSYVNLFNPERFEISELIKNIDSIDEPKDNYFFYIHANLPHPPFRYNEDCSTHKRNGEIDYTNTSIYLNEYMKQYKCSEKQSINLIKKILSFDKDPIIIITSDHGAYLNFTDMNPDIKKINKKQASQILSIFYGVKLPDNFCSPLKLKRDINNNIFLYLLECLEIIEIVKLNESATLTGYPNWPNYNKLRKIDIKDLYK